MKTPWIELTFIIFGWLLGIVSGPIQDWFRQRRERKRLCLALWTDLNELRERLALAILTIESKRDGISRDLLAWTRRYISNWNGGIPSGALTEISGPPAEMSDEEFSAMTKSIQQGKEGLVLQHYELKYLASKLDRIALLPESTQQQLLSILTHLGFINQLVTNSEFYRGLTFDSNISDENYAIASTELKKCRNHVAAQARSLVGTIDLLENELRNPK